MQTTHPQPAFIEAEFSYAATTGDPLVVIEPPEGMGDATRNFSNDIRTLPVANARVNARSPTLDKEGFALVEHDSSFQHFDSPDQIKETYYPEAEQLVVKCTGASRVLAFDHNIRVDDSGEDHRKPAGIVHVDVTDRSARRIVEEQFPAEDAANALRGRIVFINSWTPLINRVYSSHLALCDASTVPEASLLKAELRYENRTGELFYCAFHDDHRWYYFPQMDPHEVLLLKNYDSETDGRARFTPHTAIVDSTAPKTAPARKSIEVRTIALFE